MQQGDQLDGRYQLIDVLGSGGVAVVWQGHDWVLNRTVAVKVLGQSARADPVVRRRMLDEAQAAASITHPHLVRVHDYGEVLGSDGQRLPYVVMEFLTGRTLDDPGVLRSLSPGEAVKICRQVADALAALHRHGLVHRDIKPANVMLTPDGAKVIDFGIAAATGSAELDERGVLLGTPSHLAPERLLGGEVSPAADVYAFGVLAYWLLTHRLPWPTRPADDTLRAHLTLDPRPMPPIDGVPSHVADVCQRCLDRDPQARPTAAEVASALNAKASPTPIRRDIATWRAAGQAIAAEEAERTHRQRRRRTILAVSGAAAVAVALTAFIPSIGRSGDASAALEPPSSSQTEPQPTANASPAGTTSPTTTITQAAAPLLSTTTTAAGTTQPGTNPPAAPTDHTLRADGGTVHLRCQGNAATLVSAQPAAGFEITTSNARPTQIQVVFTSTTHQSDIKARCGPQGIVPTIKETAI
jgi:serine/threonine-protein kinase